MKPYAWIILLQSCTKPSIWGYTVNIVVWVQSSRKWLHVPCNDYYHNYHYNETNDESGCSVVTPFLRQKPGWPFWKPFNTLSIRLISKPIVCMCVCVLCVRAFPNTSRFHLLWQLYVATLTKMSEFGWVLITRRPFFSHDLTLNPTGIINDINYEVWVEITHPIPNFNGAAVNVWEFQSYFIPHFTGLIITYPCLE